MMNHGIIRITILIIPCDERYKQLISEQGRAYILKQEGVGARTTKKKKTFFYQLPKPHEPLRSREGVGWGTLTLVVRPLKKNTLFLCVSSLKGGREKTRLFRGHFPYQSTFPDKM